MKLERYIADLLKNHDCVIVPDFGGFVANYKSAVIDQYSKRIHPPSKSVLFNPHLTNNDGLLGNYVAQKRDTDYPNALSFIANEVTYWNNSFEKGERIEIGEIGFLYRENGIVHFEQSRDINLLLQAYGLKSINFVKFQEAAAVQKPAVEKQVGQPTEEREVVEEQPAKVIEIIDETVVKEKKIAPTKVIKEATVVTSTEKDGEIIALNQQEKIQTVATEKQVGDDVIPIRRNVTKTVLKYAAAVAFVPILFYSYWIPMETDALETSTIQLKDFNPIHEQPQKSYEVRNNETSFESMPVVRSWNELTENINAQVYNFEVAEDFYVTVALEKDEVTPNNEIGQNEQVTGDYHVIAGCFSVKSNAENLVKDLRSQGFQASILDKSKGLTRVTAGGYSSRDAAHKGLDKLKNSGQSGWILKK